MTTDTVGWNSPHLKESQWEGYIDGQRRVEVDGEWWTRVSINLEEFFLGGIGGGGHVFLWSQLLSL